jgi:hypothetical protein
MMLSTASVIFLSISVDYFPIRQVVSNTDVAFFTDVEIEFSDIIQALFRLYPFS